MAAMIGLALAVGGGARRGGAASGGGSGDGNGGDGGGGPPSPLAAHPFARDLTVFDSGAALGRAAAIVPVSGTGAPPGARVQARAVVADAENGLAAGQVVAPETPVATAGAGGEWAGALEVPRAPAWLFLEVRAEGGAWVRRPGRFAAGHVIYEWEQSGKHHIILGYNDALAHPVLAHPGDVRFSFIESEDGRPVGTVIADNAPKGSTRATGAMKAYADTLTLNRPGEKFHVAFDVQGGTGWEQTVDEEDTERGWARTERLAQFVQADGVKVGLHHTTWLHNNLGSGPQGLLDGWGKIALGNTLTTDEDVATPFSAFGREVEHTLAELFDYAHSRWAWAMPSYFGYAGQSFDTYLRGVHLLPGARGRILRHGIGNGKAVQGEQNGDGTFRDPNHHANDNPDGLYRLARGSALDCLTAMGLVVIPDPVMDRCEWEPSGAHVEVWSSAYPLTTTRRIRGLPPIDLSLGGPEYQDWAGEVEGFQINGQAARRTSIANGRVRILPPEGRAAFTNADALTFDRRGSGDLPPLRYQVNNRWYDRPVAASTRPGVDTFNVHLLRDDVLANTLTGGTRLFGMTREGPKFYSPSGVLGDVKEMTFAFEMLLPDTSEMRQSGAIAPFKLIGDNVLFGMDVRPTKRGAWLRVSDEQGSLLADVSLGNNAYTYAAKFQVVGSFKMASEAEGGHVFVRTGGKEARKAALPDAAFVGLPSYRSLHFMAVDRGFQFSPLRYWVGPGAADGAGTLPSRAPDFELPGTLSALNAHPWKSGADAT